MDDLIKKIYSLSSGLIIIFPLFVSSTSYHNSIDVSSVHCKSNAIRINGASILHFLYS